MHVRAAPARARRLAVIAVAGAFLALTISSFAGTAPAAAADQTDGTQFLCWDDGTECPTQANFGSGSGITIGFGNDTYHNDCDAGGVNDQFEVAMKVYIVAAGAANGQALTDVGGSPNVIQSSGTSGFLDEFIGTAGVNIPTGTYDVVYDECEDGVIGPEDAIFHNAITVTSPPPGSVPSIDAGIQKIKQDAQAEATGWENTLFAWQSLNTLLDAYDRASCIMDVVECYLGPDALLGYFQSSVQSALGVDDPKEAATNVLVNTVGHYQGIANDPADPAYKQATALPPVAFIDPHSSDPTLRSAVSMVNGASQEDANAAALLHSIERYKGAQSANDPQWALVQATTIKRYAGQLSSQITRDNSLLQSYKTALDGDSRNPNLDDLRSKLAQVQQQVATYGFNSEQRDGLHNAGLTDAQINALKSKLLADTGLTKTRQDLTKSFQDQIDVNSAAKAKYDTLVSDTQATIDSLKSDPVNQSDPGIAASAGGPYSPTQGQPIQLDASGTTGSGPLQYRWDTDGDGQFDDATGQAPTVTFAEPIDGQVGVKVTRTGGSDQTNPTLEAIAYAPVHVAAANHPPVIDRASPYAPTPNALTIAGHRGSALQFTIDPSDPDTGDVLSVQWRVDGGAFANGTNAFSTTFGASVPLGLHYVTAKVRDDSGLSNDTTTRTWTVDLQDTDSDGDGWSDTFDCAAGDASVHPGASEVPGNGKNDDCDTSTPDSQTQGGTLPGGGGSGGGASGSGGASSGSGGGSGKGGGGSGGGTTAAPAFVAASITNRVFAVDPRGVAETPVTARLVKKGTVFAYTLSNPGRVLFTIERVLPGRKAGSKCLKPSRSRRRKKKCTRYTLFGRFAQQGVAGKNSKPWSGKIGSKKVKPGRYRATLTATDSAGHRSAPKTLAFKVVRG